MWTCGSTSGGERSRPAGVELAAAVGGDRAGRGDGRDRRILDRQVDGLDRTAERGMDARIADDESGRRHRHLCEEPRRSVGRRDGRRQGRAARRPDRGLRVLAARRDAQDADHAVGLVAGQVADVLERVGGGERDRRPALAPGRDRDLGRPGVVDRLGAGPVALVEAASPTIHSWSIGSVFVITNVTGLPTGTVIRSGS